MDVHFLDWSDRYYPWRYFCILQKVVCEEDVETFVIKDYLKEEIDGIRQDFRNAKKEMIRIMFLLAVAYELILVGALLLVT